MLGNGVLVLVTVTPSFIFGTQDIFDEIREVFYLPLKATKLPHSMPRKVVKTTLK